MTADSPIADSTDHRVLGHELSANGHGPLEEPRMCALEGCQQVLSGKQVAYCSEAHQRRAGVLRQRGAQAAQPVPGEVASLLWSSCSDLLDAGVDELSFRAGGLRVRVSR
jgi:hypothetical protein